MIPSTPLKFSLMFASGFCAAVALVSMFSGEYPFAALMVIFSIIDALLALHKEPNNVSG